MSMENELLAAVYSLLNGDSTLKNSSGINPLTGAARALTIHNQVTQNQAVPYVRITLTDLVPMDDEPFNYGYVPTAKSIFLLVDAFSDYEPEVFNISARLQALLGHYEITTTTYHGSTWLQSVDYFTDNTSDVDRVYRRASLRVRCNLEPR